MSRTTIYVHVNIVLYFPISYIYICFIDLSECACLHKTVNIVVFYVNCNENTNPKGRALMQIYRVVPQMKRESKALIL